MRPHAGNPPVGTPSQGTPIAQPLVSPTRTRYLLVRIKHTPSSNTHLEPPDATPKLSGHVLSSSARFTGALSGCTAPPSLHPCPCHSRTPDRRQARQATHDDVRRTAKMIILPAQPGFDTSGPSRCQAQRLKSQQTEYSTGHILKSSYMDRIFPIVQPKL